MLGQARTHLEQADRLGVADSDRPKLTYRLAKTWLLLGLDAAQVVAALQKSIELADDPSEGFGLLAKRC